jgi:1-acyl-sn-glycerol-3-phosphate acyltransferase
VPSGVRGLLSEQLGLKDYRESLKNHIKLLKEKNTVCIFPEGRISKTGSLGDVHGGVVYLASVSHAPIIPVTITGAYKITLRELLGRKRHIQVRIGKPQYDIHSHTEDPAYYRETARAIMETQNEHIHVYA